MDSILPPSDRRATWCICSDGPNQVYLYTAYFHKIQGCLQYKTMYVKIKIKNKKIHIIITNIYIIKQS